jgi:hypothetical protein
MNRRLGIGREGGIGGRSAQQIERHFDRFIVRFVRRNIGLRAGLLGTFGFEVAAQRCFALGVDLSLQVVRNVLQDFDVRRCSVSVLANLTSFDPKMVSFGHSSNSPAAFRRQQQIRNSR